MGSLRSMMRGLFYPERGVSMDKYRKMSERAEEGFNLVLREVERNNRLLAQNDRLLDKIELLITDHVASTQTIRELTQRLDDVCESWEEDVSTIKKLGPFAIYGWNTLIFNQSRQLRRSRSRLECEVRTQPFQTHSWLELLSLKGLSDVLRFPLYGRVLHTAFWPE